MMGKNPSDSCREIRSHTFDGFGETPSQFSKIRGQQSQFDRISQPRILIEPRQTCQIFKGFGETPSQFNMGGEFATLIGNFG